MCHMTLSKLSPALTLSFLTCQLGTNTCCMELLLGGMGGNHTILMAELGLELGAFCSLGSSTVPPACEFGVFLVPSYWGLAWG